MANPGRFVSYVNRYEVEMEQKRNATFRSYIDGGCDDEEPNEEVAKKAVNFFSKILEPSLLNGEKVIAHADSVLKYSPFSERKQGVSGHLFVTNFRISFITSDKSSYDQSDSTKESYEHRKHKLLGDHDIPLTRVDTVYQIISGGRRKQLTPGQTVNSHTKYLEVHSKDFQIHTFGFKFCAKDQSKLVTNAIIHHCYPTRSDLLFAYDFGHSKTIFPEQIHGTRLFNSKLDWEEEVARLGAVGRWRITDINREFCAAISLPEYFVVPVGLLNAVISKAVALYNNYRLPIWCYTHCNGCSLVRMSHIRPESELKEYHKQITDAIKQACDLTDTPKPVDLSRLCVSLRELQQSFEKLKECCMTDSVKDFVSTDLSWFSNLDASQWLHAVVRCLRITFSIAVNIDQEKQTVIIEEETGCDFTCVVSSLVQICLDPHCRTQVGFQSLIQKEWVALGHPFQKRYRLTLENEVDMAPVFLLFLDCTWQLLQQFPSCFAFSETYLTTLWDSIFVGLFDTFLFNNGHQRRKFMREGRKMAHITLPSIWDWQFQFSDMDMALFNNPLYVIHSKIDLDEAIGNAEEENSRKVFRDHMYKKKLVNLYTDEKLFPRFQNVILPNFSPLAIKLWKQCYIRWNAPSQIIGGGAPSQYLQQCLLVEEVIHLQHRVNLLKEEDRRKMQVMRPKSQLIFSLAEPAKTSTALRCFNVTSSFPFACGPITKDYQKLIYSPLVDYVQSSTIDYDYTGSTD